MTTTIVNSLMTGPGDVRDQHWLDDQIEAIESGVGAVVDIARNWTEGRNLARLHPGVSAAAYITERVGVLGKSVVPVLLAESNWSNRQIAAIAGVAHTTVARIAEATGANAPVEHFDNPATWQPGHDYRPEKTLGADGKYRPARVVREVVAQVIEPADEPGPDDDDPAVEPGGDDQLDAAVNYVMNLLDIVQLELREHRQEPYDVAGRLRARYPRRAAATARRLRKVGRHLGAIAWHLEREDAR